MQKQIAVYSKRPGDSNLDYRVLDFTPGTLCENDLESIFRSFTVGNLTTIPNSEAESAPWYIAGSWDHDNDGAFQVGIYRDWTEYKDSDNRRIQFSVAICIQHGALNISELYDLTPKSPNIEEYKNRTLREIQPHAHLKKHINKIEEFSFENCAGIAALMIENRVALVGSKHLQMTIEDQLSYFDAILSLLPRGARTGFGISSWLSGSVAKADNIRLCFTDISKDDHKRVEFQKPVFTPSNHDQGKFSREYFLSLQNLKETVGLEKICEHLQNQTQYFPLAEPKAILSSLTSLAKPYLIGEKINKKRLDYADIQELSKDRTLFRSLSLSQQQEVIKKTIEFSVVLDDDAIIFIAENWSSTYEGMLVGSISKAFREQNAKKMASHFSLVSYLNEFENILIKVLNGNKEYFDTRKSCLSFARLLDAHFSAIRRVESQTLAHAIRQEEKLVYCLLDITETAREWLTWLKPKYLSGSVLHPLYISHALISDTATENEINLVARVDKKYLRSLVQISIKAGSLPQLLPAVTAWLLRNQGELREADWQSLMKSIDYRKYPRKENGDMAGIDIICTLINHPAPFLYNNFLQKPDYGECLVAKISSLNGYDEPSQKTAVELLTKQLIDREHFYETEEYSRHFISFAESLRKRNLKNEIVEEFVTGLRERHHQVRLKGLVKNNASIETVAEYLATSLIETNSENHIVILEQLSNWSKLDDYYSVEEFVVELRRYMVGKTSEDEIREVGIKLKSAIMDGKLGKSLAYKYRWQLFDSLSDKVKAITVDFLVLNNSDYIETEQFRNIQEQVEEIANLAKKHKKSWFPFRKRNLAR